MRAAWLAGVGAITKTVAAGLGWGSDSCAGMQGLQVVFHRGAAWGNRRPAAGFPSSAISRGTERGSLSRVKDRAGRAAILRLNGRGCLRVVTGLGRLAGWLSGSRETARRTIAQCPRDGGGSKMANRSNERGCSHTATLCDAQGVAVRSGSVTPFYGPLVPLFELFSRASLGSAAIASGQ